MIEIDDIVQSSIDPQIWKNLPAIKKLKILNYLYKIKEIVHSPNSFSKKLFCLIPANVKKPVINLIGFFYILI